MPLGINARVEDELLSIERKQSPAIHVWLQRLCRGTPKPERRKLGQNSRFRAAMVKR